MAFYQNNQLQQEIEEFKKSIGLNNSFNTSSNTQYNSQNNSQKLPQQSYFLPQQQYNQKPDKYDSNDNNNNEKEFRDDINEKVNNLKFSLPTQARAQHFFDSTIIENNPQYIKTNDDLSRRDCRDGMNNRMDTLMFQQFQQPQQSQQSPQPQKIYQQQQYQHNNQTNNQPNNQPNSQSEFTNQLPNNFNNFFQQTNRVTNRDSNNERIQEFTSLPRALNQPTQMIDTRPILSQYKSSYQDSHKPVSQYQEPTQYQNQNQNQNTEQAKYEQYYNSNVLNNESFLRKNESGRNNYKDSHNTRLQELSPLSRTCALPATTSDYTKSVQQSITLFDGVKTFKKHDMENRQELAEQRKQEWQRMSNNLIHVGKPPTVVVDNNRPLDTRQL
jgi:hypothetical protein